VPGRTGDLLSQFSSANRKASLICATPAMGIHRPGRQCLGV